MADQPHKGVPYDGEGQRLWQSLESLPKAQPGDGLRQQFYAELDRASQPGWAERLAGRFGMVAVLAPAAACLALGLVLGLVFRQGGLTAGDPIASPQLAALEARVTQLNRQLILDQLEADATSTRLRGVIAASGEGVQDPQLASALLRLASADNSASVRGAAIDALAPKIAEPEVGDSLMTLLVNAESPLVQLSLVNLVLRHGTGEQVSQLLKLAAEQQLNPDLIPYVESSVERSEI
ncbi:MAG: hypothetical protein AAGA23_21640 [Pseudomonadota bacterium]